jgi:hypothetical protein
MICIKRKDFSDLFVFINLFKVLGDDEWNNNILLFKMRFVLILRFKIVFFDWSGGWRLQREKQLGRGGKRPPVAEIKL